MICITGFGLVTPLGSSSWSTYRALLAGRTCGDRLPALPEDVELSTMVRAVGCVASVQHAAGDPALELAERAAREALLMAGVTGHQLPCVIGASKGAITSLGHTLQALHRHTHRSDHPPLSPPQAQALALGSHGLLTVQLRQRLNLGPTQHVVAACASSLTALHVARRWLMQEPELKRVLVVTAEAALTPMFIHSYKRLGVLAGDRPATYHSRPLDQARSGFTLGEMGAAVVLEKVETSAPQHEGYVLHDTAIAAEGYDMIRVAEGLPGLSHLAAQLFARAAAAGQRLEAVHPHATATPDNDQTELAVYERCATPHGPRLVGEGDTWPKVYASKGALGHSLGSAGLVSLVLALLAIKTRQLPPMPWLHNPIDSHWLKTMTHPTTSPQLLPSTTHSTHSRPPVHAIFAAGFGGHIAGAVVGPLSAPVEPR